MQRLAITPHTYVGPRDTIMKFIALHSRGGNYLVVASNVAWLRAAENGQTQIGIVGGQPLLVAGSMDEIVAQLTEVPPVGVRSRLRRRTKAIGCHSRMDRDERSNGGEKMEQRKTYMIILALAAVVLGGIVVFGRNAHSVQIGIVENCDSHSGEGAGAGEFSPAFFVRVSGAGPFQGIGMNIFGWNSTGRELLRPGN
eukprot:gene25369-46382_t